MDKKTIEKYIDVVSKFIDFDLKEELKKTTHRINLYLHGEQQLIFKAFVYNEREEFGFALYCLKEVIQSVLTKYSITLDDIKPEPLKKLFDELTSLNKISEDYTYWEQHEWLVFLENIKSHSHFTEPDYEKLDKITPDVLIHVDESLQQIDLSIFKKGEAELPESNVFVLSDFLFASEDLNTLMKAVSKYPSDEQFHVFPLLKWEENMNFSYFVFCITYKDHVLLVSDQPSFDNPRNKELQGSRNGGLRTRRDDFEKLGFPYELLEKRGKSDSTDMVLNGYDFKTALEKFSIKEFHPYTKLYLNLFIQRSIEKFRTSNNIKQVGFFDDFIETKLLGDGTLITSDDTFGGYKNSVERVQEILNDVNEPISTSIVKTSKDIIKDSKYYDSQTLMPIEKFKHLSDWFILEEKRKKIQIELDKKEFGKKEDKKALIKLLNKRIHLVESKLFVSDELYFESSESIYETGSFHNERSRKTTYFISDSNNNTWTDISFGHTDEHRIKDWECISCGKFPPKQVKKIRIDSAEQLVWLLDLNSVEDLPPYYRLYKSHNLIPYRGNQILDDTHPLVLLQDPCSRDNSNHITLCFWSCGFCSRKLNKKYNKYKKAVVKNGVVCEWKDGDKLENVSITF